MQGSSGGDGKKGGGFTRRGVAQVSEIANPMIDRVLARKAGISTALLGSWTRSPGRISPKPPGRKRSPGRAATMPAPTAATSRAC